MSITRFTSLAVIVSVKQLIRALFYGVIGATLVIMIFAVSYLNDRPDLKAWHTADLDEEFTENSKIKTFHEYLVLEERLFNQLNEKVYAKTEPADKNKINRYSRSSLSDPEQWPTNWNRSFELKTDAPRIGVLLLHGMSDSPYSLHNLAQKLNDNAAWVVGLRIPGHGTAPVGLVDTTWQDMAAAVRLAMQHLQNQLKDKPLFIVGYSNGGALAVLYSLSSLEDKSLPQPSGLVLLSPEIGVTKLAGLAIWQERLGHLLGLEKLKWNSILPEYDPFKYMSFALNAGKQTYLITNEIQNRLSHLESKNILKKLPSILAFQSVVDTTVTAPALVEELFERLPAGNHRLTLFDINRNSEIEAFLNNNPTAWVENILNKRKHDYEISLITNKNPTTNEVVIHTREAGSNITNRCSLDAKWPRDVYSLSHVALPFAPNDPLYGIQDTQFLALGKVALRGEHGVLSISPADMLRQRWNPFYGYQEQSILNHLGLLDLTNQVCNNKNHFNN